jgi:hypothetical protein
LQNNTSIVASPIAWSQLQPEKENTIQTNMFMSVWDDVTYMFSTKVWRKNLRSFAQATAIFCESLIITSVFAKNAIFSPKIGEHSIDPFSLCCVFFYLNECS